MVKIATQWKPATSSGTTVTTNSDVTRLLQDGTTRIEQDSSVRKLNESVVTEKTPVIWANK